MEHWIFLMFFIRVHCQHTVTYVVRNEASFNEAFTMCQDSGFLTDVSSMEEVNSGILPAVSDTLPSKGNFSFWIGLKKFRERCFEKGQPLLGFVWTVNNSSLSDVKKWRYHPRETCLNMLCGSLSVEYSGSSITDWGFEEKTCNMKQKFICKVSEKKSARPDKNRTLNKKGTGFLLRTRSTDSPGFILSVQPPVKNNAPSTSTLRMVTVTAESSEIQHSKLSVFMPVLIVLSVLVLLVIVILVIVKCCLIRRTKKCKGVKGPKSKESVDLKDRDSEEQSNEKDSLRN